MKPPRLSHLDKQSGVHMVDVSGKAVTSREALAEGQVRMTPEALAAVTEQSLVKGDLFTVAQIAGIQAAKRTSELIPLCHLLPLTLVEVTCTPDPDLPGVRIRARVRCESKTGPEMEALTAVAGAALTVVDMAKSVDPWMTIEGIQLLAKAGGKSGSVKRSKGKG